MLVLVDAIEGCFRTHILPIHFEKGSHLSLAKANISLAHVARAMILPRKIKMRRTMFRAMIRYCRTEADTECLIRSANL